MFIFVKKINVFMVSEVIMKRVLFGEEISQKSKSEFFSATDLVRAGNKWRKDNNMIEFNLSQFMSLKGTIEFISELEKKFNTEIIIKGRGRNSNTWVHPLLFIDIALAISPQLKIEVYQWLFDYLIKYRNYSGDSYKKMCGALFLNSNNKSEFPPFITVVATNIQDACNVKDWQQATENQLKLRDTIHNNIAILASVLKDNNQVVRIGILNAIS